MHVPRTPKSPGAGKLATSFYEWVAEQGYRWQGTDCRISSTGTPVGPHDFLPRRLMGEYLEWAYETLLAEAPTNVTIRHHATRRSTSSRRLTAGSCCTWRTVPTCTLDQVVLTTGHSMPRRDAGDRWGAW